MFGQGTNAGKTNSLSRFALTAGLCATLLLTASAAAADYCCQCYSADKKDNKTCVTDPSNDCAGMAAKIGNGYNCDNISSEQCKSVSTGGSAICLAGPIQLASFLFVPSSDAFSANQKPATPPVLNVPIPGLNFGSTLPIKGGKTDVPWIAQYITAIYNYALGLSLIAAAVMIVFGGFRYIMGASLGDIMRGKEIIKDALIGLILVFGTYAILYTVNTHFTNGFQSIKFATTKEQQELLSSGKNSSLMPSDLCRDMGASANEMFDLATTSTTSASSTGNGVVSAETRCGKKYTQRSSGDSCNGFYCSEGYQCISCETLPAGAKKSIKDCSSQSTACIKAAIIGTINWSGGIFPVGIFPMFACSGAIAGYSSVTQLRTSIPTLTGMFREKQFEDDYHISSASDTGSILYHWDFPKSFNDYAQQYCKSINQTFLGFFIVINYWTDRKGAAGTNATLSADTSTSTNNSTASSTNSGNADFNGAGFGVILKKNCGSSSNFSGYGGTGEQQAFICGAYFAEKQASNNKVKDKLDDYKQIAAQLQDKNSYWSLQDIDNAEQGTTPLACDIQLNSANAPGDPESTIYSNLCDFAD